jgi:glycosyltransferase involved in cell wall biosynthesis
VRILFLSNDRYPPYRVDVAELFARKLSARGHRIDWLLQSRRPCRRSYDEPYGGGRAWVGRSVAGTSPLRRLQNGVLDLWHDLKVFRLVRSQRPDIVLVRDKVVAAVLALLAARVHRSEFVYWHSYPIGDAAILTAREGSARSPWLAMLRGRSSRLLLYRLILPRVAHMFVQSCQMMRDLEDLGLERAKMTPVPMGVASERMPHPYPVSRVSKPAGERWIVYLGTLARVRGLGVLIRATGVVCSRLRDVRLYLVGAGDNSADERAIRGEIERAGLSRYVVVTGMLEMEHAWEYVALADVCVSPFRATPVLQSTSPTKLIEYMALGRPVVASSHPEQDEIIRECQTGLSVPYSEEAFAEAILRILRDPAEAQRMGQRGRVYATTRRDYEIIANLVESRLADVLGRRLTRG